MNECSMPVLFIGLFQKYITREEEEKKRSIM